ncbi:phosphoribosylanthranilate isomerase [Flavobacterium pedocola]
MKLKICGMKYPANIQQVVMFQPDYLGFIFYEKSPRYFSGNLPLLPKSTQKVGVFVDAYLDDIIGKITRYNLQLVQLHGNESPEFCKLFKQLDIKVIKTFSIDDSFDFQTIKPYETVCDYFLFDTKGNNPGGNGTTFNWQILKNYPSQKPFFLSGGIGLDEISEINLLNLPIHAVDVNSKLEIKPGLKNVKECGKLIQLIKLYKFIFNP